MPNKLLNKQLGNGRQWTLIAVQPFTFENFADTAVAVQVLNMPPNAVISGGAIIVETAFNTATTATADVGDATVGNRYGAAIDLKTVGRKPLTATGFKIVDGANLLLTPALAGAAATAGAGRIEVHYYIDGRVTENQTS